MPNNSSMQKHTPLQTGEDENQYEVMSIRFSGELLARTGGFVFFLMLGLLRHFLLVAKEMVQKSPSLSVRLKTAPYYWLPTVDELVSIINVTYESDYTSPFVSGRILPSNQPLYDFLSTTTNAESFDLWANEEDSAYGSYYGSLNDTASRVPFHGSETIRNSSFNALCVK